MGNERLLLGIIGIFVFFGISFFVAGGGLGLRHRGSGGPVGVFENIEHVFLNRVQQTWAGPSMEAFFGHPREPLSGY